MPTFQLKTDPRSTPAPAPVQTGPAKPSVVIPVTAPAPVVVGPSLSTRPVDNSFVTVEPVAKGNVLKKVGGFLAGVASFVVPGVGSKVLSGVSQQLLKPVPSLTPKITDTPGGTLTPKFDQPALPINPVVNLGGASFTAAEKDGGLGAVLGLKKETVPVWVYILGGVALVLLLPGLLKRRR